MVSDYLLPTLEVVEQTLSAFVRRDVFVSLNKQASDGHLPLAGLYHDGHQKMVVACMADIAFAAASAAAFALIPARVAAEAATEQKLDESLVEIFAEVLNVMSRLFTHHDNLRVTLAEKVLPGQPLPELLASIPNERCLDLFIEIDGYPKGRLILCLLTS